MFRSRAEPSPAPRLPEDVQGAFYDQYPWHLQDLDHWEKVQRSQLILRGEEVSTPAGALRDWRELLGRLGYNPTGLPFLRVQGLGTQDGQLVIGVARGHHPLGEELSRSLHAWLPASEVELGLGVAWHVLKLLMLTSQGDQARIARLLIEALLGADTPSDQLGIARMAAAFPRFFDAASYHGGEPGLVSGDVASLIGEGDEEGWADEDDIPHHLHSRGLTMALVELRDEGRRLGLCPRDLRDLTPPLPRMEADLARHLPEGSPGR